MTLQQLDPPEAETVFLPAEADPTEALIREARRRARRRRRRFAAAAIVGVGLVGGAILAGGGHGPGGLVALDSGMPSGTPAADAAGHAQSPAGAIGTPGAGEDIFAGTHGWIAAGGGASPDLVIYNPVHPSQRKVLMTGDGWGGAAPLAWSPDGSKVLVLRGLYQGRLYVLDGSGRPRQLTGAGTSAAGFTKDGSQVVYIQNGLLFRMPVSGGIPRMIDDAFSRGSSSLAVSPDQSMVAYERHVAHPRDASIWLINTHGFGQKRELVSLRQIADRLGWNRRTMSPMAIPSIHVLAWVPGNKILFTTAAHPWEKRVMRCPLWTIRPDGSHLHRWGPSYLCPWSATLSPDGMRIAAPYGNSVSFASAPTRMLDARGHKVVVPDAPFRPVTSPYLMPDPPDEGRFFLAWRP